MDCSRLKLNADKTQFIWIGSCGQISKIDINEIQIACTTVELSKSVKDLGINVDSIV